MIQKVLSKYLRTRIKYIRGNCDADVDLKVLGLAEMPRISIDYFGDFSFLLIHGEQFEENSLEQFLNARMYISCSTAIHIFQR